MASTTMSSTEEDDESQYIRLQEAVQSHPDDPSHQFSLGLFLWSREGIDCREKAAEHFMLAAKLNSQNGEAFRYLGDYYSRFDLSRALKCYQRAVSLNPDDSHSGETLCDLLDKQGKESLEMAVCREASAKSSRAFWALSRLGCLLVHQKKWSEAVPNLQHAIRGYPKCADLWEALGLAYQRLGMYTAAIKSYGRAMELEDSKVFAMIESGNIFLGLGSFRKGIEQFRQALQMYPQNIAARYGLASGLLALSKECIDTGAFTWAASLLEEAAEIANSSTSLAGNMASIWKLHGDIQLSYAKCLPWIVEGAIPDNEEAFTASIVSWRNKCFSAGLLSKRSYQRALQLAPWQANIYIDVAISADLCCSLDESCKMNLASRQLPEKMALGSLLLECGNHEFWVALGCLSGHKALKQHAFIKGLHLDVSLAIAWAYLGKLYGEEGDKQLARQAFDRARSIDPSLALPWAGMSADIHNRDHLSDEAYESCLRAVQIKPVAEFQMGLTQLALSFGHISSPLVFGAIRQAVQRAPYYPESHNLHGLVSEARLDYESAVASYRLARLAMKTYSSTITSSHLTDITVNLARVHTKAGNAFDAVEELDAVKKRGSLDVKGLQIYVISLWGLGKGDLALAAARELLGHTASLEPSSAAASITLICRLLYSISGIESTNSILKMRKELFQSSKVSFVVSAIHALDRSNRLEPVVSISRNALSSHEEITEMHLLIALSKMIKQGSESRLEWQLGLQHLRKVLHKYPNNTMLRNSLGYILGSSNCWETYHVANRCYTLMLPDHPDKVGLKSPHEILGAEAVACHASEYSNFIYSSSCRYSSIQIPSTVQQMQRWLHLEPWNDNARYLLILTLLRKAGEASYRQYFLDALKRMIDAALVSEFYLLKSISSQYQKFQLLLCASEISLRGGDLRRCISFAKNASELSLPGSYIFFAHLQLCRAHATEDNHASLEKDYYMCLKLQTRYPIGWICLKLIISLTSLENDPNALDSWFAECLKDDAESLKMWMAVYKLVCGLTSFWAGNFLHAEEYISEACSLSDTESGLFLCHGAICMELARKQCGTHYLSSAVKSLRRALECSSSVLPYAPLMLAQAEGSLGSKEKWERNLRYEWFSWPSDTRPAEIYFQMHLLAKDLKYGTSDTSRHPECQRSPEKWILQAIHLNPSSTRYWNALYKLTT